jgi:hypothetical protein
MTTWDISKAKLWLLEAAIDHMRDGLFAEGGELFYEANWGDGYKNVNLFYGCMRSICCWSDDSIEDAIEEIHQ